MHSIHDPVTNSMIHLNFFGVWQQCNQGLFTAKPCDRASQDAILSKLTWQLSSAEQALCEGPLALDRFLSPLSGMGSGNTPGSYGFPMEFYLAFWPSLGEDLVRASTLLLNVMFTCSKSNHTQRPLLSQSYCLVSPGTDIRSSPTSLSGCSTL